MSEQRKQISLSSVVEDLQNGVTRTPKSKGYSPERGSIQEKYELTYTEVTLLFKHPKLKGVKTRIPQEVSFDLVDDLSERVATSPGYGAPSASAVERMNRVSISDQQPASAETSLDIDELNF